MMNGELLAARALHLSLTALIVTAIFVRPTVFQQAISERRLFAPILYIFSAICSIVLYFVVSCMDPGYVKKDDADVEPLEVIVDDEAGGSNDEDASLFQVKHDKNNDSVKFNLKPHQRCGFCRLKKPMRAKHCRDCKRCVRRFDHHCFWMANCVGERNHKFFLLFITSELALLIWSFNISLSGFVKPADGEEWISVNLLLVIADIFIGVFVFVTFILFTMHTYSAFTNNTTWESISKQRIPYLSKLTANPFDMGFCRNFYLFCCVCRAQDWTKYYENAKSNLLKKTTTTTTGGGYRKLETPARGHEFSDDDDDGEETTFSREQLHTSLQVENEQS